MVDGRFIAFAVAATLLVNIPFGFWRGYAGRMGRRLEWILAVHAPVPLIVLFRSLAGIRLSIADVPLLALFVAAYFLGQRIGGMLYARASSAGAASTRCFLRGLQCILNTKKC